MTNNIIEAMKKRRSIRKYKPDMIPDEVIDEICEAGTFAASGRGKQCPIIIAVKNRKLRDKLSRMNCKIGGWSEDFDPFYGAPVVLIILAPKDIPTYVYDGSLVIGNIMLAADSLGIGNCWIHRAKQEFESDEGKEILKELGIEGDYEGIGHVILGYTDGKYPDVIPRKENRIFKIN